MALPRKEVGAVVKSRAAQDGVVVPGHGCYLAGFKGDFPEASKKLNAILQSQVPCGWEHIEPALCGAASRQQLWA